MSSEMHDTLQEEAIRWHIRLRGGDDAAWDEFTEWLAQDSRHREAYEAIENADLAIEALLPHVVFPKDSSELGTPVAGPRFTVRRGWLVGGALAASITISVLVLRPQTSSEYEVRTQPGRHQTVALDATTQVALNGATRMRFDRNNPRFAALISGEALFRVRHDSARPFALQVGIHRIVDVGTVFNVVREANEVRVAVAEGQVTYGAEQGPVVNLNAGQVLLDRGDSTAARVTTTPSVSVGAWENGRLVYANERMAQVAADLGRSLGVNIVVSPAVADRLFSGTLVLNGTGAAQLERLKAALNVNLTADPAGWRMQPLDDGGR